LDKKQNKTKQNKTKQNKAKQNKAKQNNTKQNKTKNQGKICRLSLLVSNVFSPSNTGPSTRNDADIVLRVLTLFPLSVKMIVVLRNLFSQGCRPRDWSVL